MSLGPTANPVRNTVKWFRTFLLFWLLAPAACFAADSNWLHGEWIGDVEQNLEFNDHGIEVISDELMKTLEINASNSRLSFQDGLMHSSFAPESPPVISTFLIREIPHDESRKELIVSSPEHGEHIYHVIRNSRGFCLHSQPTWEFVEYSDVDKAWYRSTTGQELEEGWMEFETEVVECFKRYDG